MRLLIAAVGRLKAGPERELLARFIDRANASGRSLALTPIEITEIPESTAQSVGKRKTDEAKALLSSLPSGAKLIALDERGKNVTSTEFANTLARMRDDGAPCAALLIGGADGLDQTLRKQAAMTIAFGAVTFPHQIVRLLLAEQIYRATTILSGHPYHRGG